MKSLIAGVVFSVTLGFTSQAFAIPDLVWCQGCSAQQQNQAAMRAGRGTVYVADAINRTVVAYNVHTETDDSKQPPRPVLVADQIAPDPVIVNGLSDAIRYYNTPPVGWQKHFNESVRDGSVYNIINAGRVQNDFADGFNASWRNANADLAMLLGRTVQILASLHLVDLYAAPNLTVTATFKDGSRVDFVFDRDTSKLKLQTDTARDSHNNSVPYLGADGQIHNLGGEHDFNPSTGSPMDQQNFVNQIGRLGVQILSTGGGGGSGGIHGWACVKSGDGPDAVYTCQKY